MAAVAAADSLGERRLAVRFGEENWRLRNHHCNFAMGIFYYFGA
jgi:hypothetical protein